MFALLCRPIVVPTQDGNPRPSRERLQDRICLQPNKEGKLETEILEAPPITIGPDQQSEKF